MDHPHLDLQLGWDAAELRQRGWPSRLDNWYLHRRLGELTAAVTLAGGARRVLDVAAAEAIHTCDIALGGAWAVALDPSPAMLAAARAEIARRGATVALVRGIAETLPFRDGAFDRVLCHGAIDHVADPDRAVREMTRVLSADGRLVITAVNYASVSARLSRLLYAAGRGLRMLDREVHRFWDSPVPAEHTFECTAGVLKRLSAPYLEIEKLFGVSIGWQTPGWGVLLDRLPRRQALALLGWLDRQASHVPALGDVTYAILRPRTPRAHPVRRPPSAGGFVVQPDDVVYPYRALEEARFWRFATFAGTMFRPVPAGARLANAGHTGDPSRSWLDDLVGRGPFERVAVLGCDEDRPEADWLRRGGSARIEVYELSPHAIRKVRAGLGALRRQVRFIRADLNFAELPAGRYDLIWSSGCLHHIVNLEALFAQVERALRPGGLFALHDYVGERRMRYSPQRLARANALLAEVPARFRLGAIDAIAPPDEEALSTFCGVRSDDVLPCAEARFELVHKGLYGALFPLPFRLDIAAIAREDPALLARLVAAEEDAQRDPATPPCSAYAVFRKR